MSAKEIKSENDVDGYDCVLPQSIAIIAGGGIVPDIVAKACLEKKIDPFIVVLKGQADFDLYKKYPHIVNRIGAAGSIINTLKERGIKDLVIVGSIRRPSLVEMRPDFKTAEFFAKTGFKALGDDGVLKALRSFLEAEGFRIHGAHKIADILLMPKGVLGKHSPKKTDFIDIERGFEVSQILGGCDVGQSVVVQEGIVLGVEAAEGTDGLLKRIKNLTRKGRKGVLVKTCKPQQDRDLDMPAIGVDTIIAAAKADLAGVVVHANSSIIIDREAVIKTADKHKIFLLGFDLEDITQS